MAININIPIEDAVTDGSLNPVTSNAVFDALAGLAVSDLQSVTDQGNTTTNEIQFGSGVGILLDNASRLREGTIDAQTGGSKGIAQICAVGYELKWEAGSQYVMDGNGTLIREVNHKFNIIPDLNNDSTQGFYVGSRWILDNGDIYVCTDSTATNATWEKLNSLDELVPYTGATADVNLGNQDLYANKVWLLDAPNGAHGSIHLTDNDFHIEDSDGHKMLVIEDGFMQIHLTDTIQSNLYTSGLTQSRDHYLPDASGTIALTSDITGTNSGTNTGDETATTIKNKLGITTLSGSNTGDQDLSNLVIKNTAIVGATKTKITYDAKGLVTAGADATKSDVGLANVDNTSDANKPVSTAQQTALNLKQDTLVSATNIKTINGTTLLGSGDLVVGGSSGIFGIANASGVYTYYATFTLAMAAATSGQTIEIFADVTETGAVEITLKNGVNINGNGHTYTLNNSGTSNALKVTNSTSIDCSILNLNVVRTGSTAVQYTNNTLALGNSTSGNIYLTGSKFTNLGSGCAINIGGSSTIYVYDALAIANTGFGSIYIESTSGARVYNSTGISTSQQGISCYIGGDLYNCTGISISGINPFAVSFTNFLISATVGFGFGIESKIATTA